MAADGGSGFRRRILVLGDAEVLADARASKEVSRHELLFARSAAEAGLLLAGRPADLVVCPAELEGQSGLVLLHALQQTTGGAVVLLAASDADERAATAAGCRSVLRDAAPWAVVETLTERLRALGDRPPPLVVEVATGDSVWRCGAHPAGPAALEAILPQPVASGIPVGVTLLWRGRRLVTLGAHLTRLTGAATAAATAAEDDSEGWGDVPIESGDTPYRLALQNFDGPPEGLARALLGRLIEILARAGSSEARPRALSTAAGSEEQERDHLEPLLAELLPGLEVFASAASGPPRDTALPDAEDARVGSVLPGGYHLLERLGHETLGVRYRAQHDGLGTRVGILLLPEELGTDSALHDRVLAEARAASATGHPALLPVLEVRDVGELDGLGSQAQPGGPGESRDFVVTSELRGKRLTDVLRTEGRIDLGRALRLGRQLAEGLQAAHQSLLVHGELSPASVQLVESPGILGAEQACVVDFGLSKTRALDPTAPPPGHRAPEQLGADPGAAVDARVDIHALGVLLFEMVAGVPPFAEPPGAAEGPGRTREPAPSLSSRLPAVPGLVDTLVARALADDPARRYQSMAELISALDGAGAQLQPTSLLGAGPMQMPSLKLLAVSSGAAPPQPSSPSLPAVDDGVWPDSDATGADPAVPPQGPLAASPSLVARREDPPAARQDPFARRARAVVVPEATPDPFEATSADAAADAGADAAADAGADADVGADADAGAGPGAGMQAGDGVMAAVPDRGEADADTARAEQRAPLAEPQAAPLASARQKGAGPAPARPTTGALEADELPKRRSPWKAVAIALVVCALGGVGALQLRGRFGASILAVAPGTSDSPAADAAAADGPALPDPSRAASGVSPEAAKGDGGAPAPGDPVANAAALEVEHQQHLRRARRLLQRRDWKAAVGALERARRAKDTAQVRTLLAEAHRGLGHLKDAIRHQQVAVRKEPRKTEHQVQLGRLYVGAGDVAGACRVLVKAYQTNRTDPALRKALARYACTEP